MKAKRGKRLALIAVLAVIACAFAVALPTGDSDAETGTRSGITKVTEGLTLVDGKDYYVETSGLKIAGPETLEQGSLLYVKVGASVTITSNGQNVNVVAATGAAKEAGKDTYTVSFVYGLSINGVGSETEYTVGGDDAKNNVSITAGAAAGTYSQYGVSVADGTTFYTYYAEGTDAAVDVKGEATVTTQGV